MTLHSNDPVELIEKFYAQRNGSLWVLFGKYHLEMYLRKTPMLTIANMSMQSERMMGKGNFTRFLDEIESYYDIHIENVLNPRLNPYFRNRGYIEKICPWGGPNSFTKIRSVKEIAKLETNI